MFTATRSLLRTSTSRYISKTSFLTRGLQIQATRKEGDISSVFVSLSGVTPEPLPQPFADIKRQLIKGNEDTITASWKRLLTQLSSEISIVKQNGPSIIPSISFRDLSNPSSDFLKEVRNRGVAVIRSVVPEAEARSYKTEVEEYVKANPSTKGLPPLPRTKNLFTNNKQHSHPTIPRSLNSTGHRPNSAPAPTPTSSQPKQHS